LFGHHRHDALHELGVLVNATGLQQVLYFGGELVDGRVPGRQLAEGDRELQCLP
jgi:hypothetical protein